MGVLGRLNEINRRHPWSHNDLYGRWVVRAAGRSGRGSALDVGCGTGNLVDRLRGRFATVHGIEPDATTAEIARRRFADDPAVEIDTTSFEELDPGRRYDAITLVAVLHFLPLEPTLVAMRRRLLPGGRLVIVGSYRESTRSDLALALAALVANPIIGFIRHPRVATTPPVEMTAPTTEARETFAEIRDAVRRHLPGARIRRRLFWRYSLVYAAAS